MDLYIISGASGFVGSNLIRILNEREGEESHIRALCLPGEQRPALEGLRCEIIEADVTDKNGLLHAFDLSDGQTYDNIYVIHCAAIIEIRSKPNPELLRVNVHGTQNMMDATRLLEERADCPVRFLHVSSVHAIPVLPFGETMREVDFYDPDLVSGQYAQSKAMASALVLKEADRGLDAVILQPSGIIGPHNFSPENMKELIARVARGSMRVCVPGGYNFVDVRDVCEGILSACTRGRSGESYILSGSYISMMDLLNTVCLHAGRKPIRMNIPLGLCRLFAPLSETYYNLRKKVPLFTRYAVETVETNAVFSNEKARRELHYKTRPLEETV